MSPTQTVLWDQVEYSGNPSDFAWVLPVKPGATIELSQDSWIGSLEAATQTVITGPTPPSCPSTSPPVEYDNAGGGGGGGGCASSSESGGAAGGFSSAADAGISLDGSSAEAASPVQVISQAVVGPYDAVTVRSSQGEALGDWLRANGYAIPEAIQPTIDAFTAQGFDFIALRLAPGEGVQAMQPVRVVTQGADPSLPLRMVAAGVGANVGIELFVLSEGRYHPQNFPDATIDFTQLEWDPNAGRSNYTELMTAALATNGGTGWLTEQAGPVTLYGSGSPNPGLSTAYTQACKPIELPPPPSCGVSPEAGPSTGDDGGSGADAANGDAQVEGGDDGAPGPDGGGVDAASCQPTQVVCDDLTLAMTGIPTGSLWVTRLRAFLPSTALAADLVLEAAPSQQSVSNLHTTQKYTDPSYDPCPKVSNTSSNGASSNNASSGGGMGCACETKSARGHRYEDALLGIGLLAVVSAVVRRRRRAVRC
jgi:hypothetical protein